MARDVRFEMLLSKEDAERLDRLAAERGGSRAAVVRDLVEEACVRPSEARQPPDLERVLSAIGRRAEQGHVEAARLVFAMLGRPSVRASSTSGAGALLVQLDELRRRRGDALAESRGQEGEQPG